MTAAVPEDVREAWKRATLLGRIGRPDEVAAAVEFLLSDASSYVNASVLEVNGGEAHL